MYEFANTVKRLHIRLEHFLVGSKLISAIHNWNVFNRMCLMCGAIWLKELFGIKLQLKTPFACTLLIATLCFVTEVNVLPKLP